MLSSKTISVNKAIRRLFSNYKVCTNHSTYELLRLRDGDSIVLQGDCKIEPYACFNAGNVFCTMGAFSYSHSPLKINFNIGRYVSIARGLSTFEGNHPYDRFSSSIVTYNCTYIYQRAIDDLSAKIAERFSPIPRTRNELEPITIEHDVWIGEGVTLKPGITIGQGAVIAAKAVVTHDVPPYSIWGGAC